MINYDIIDASSLFVLNMIEIMRYWFHIFNNIRIIMIDVNISSKNENIYITLTELSSKNE